MTNYDIEAELRPVLIHGEKFIWTGKPKTGIIFRTTDAFMVPFSLLWSGIAFSWEIGVIAIGAPLFALFGIPFVLIGLYLLVGRFFIDAKKRRNTLYAVTTNRIIIKSGVFNREVQSIGIHSLSDIVLTQKSDNSGSILFGPVEFRNAITKGSEWRNAQQVMSFDLIEDVQFVYSKIVAIQRKQDISETENETKSDD